MRRIRATFILFIVIAVLLLLRLFYWQVLSSDRLSRDAFQQHYLRMALPATRGSILTSDGYPLVINRKASLVYASPKEIDNIGKFALDVAPVLGIDVASVSAWLSVPNRIWIPLKHKVEGTMLEQAKKLDLKGLGFEDEPVRAYPEASMAAQTLGFVAANENGDDTGYFGLEGYYDRELRGKNGSLLVEKDVHGAPILFGNISRIDPENGRDLVLWIDRTIQSIAENRLAEGIGKYGAKEGTVTIIEPKTGAILAMASLPSYDPRHREDYDPSLYKNPIVASGYEPGSTFKTVVMASGISYGVVKPTTTMNEDGPVTVSGYSIRTWNNQYNGVVTMTDVLKHSSNVGMVYVMRQLGRERMIKTIHAFGVGEKTGIDLEEEAVPDVRTDEQWKEIDLATSSFGQGIAVTPIMMARAAAALANGGVLMEPHIVKEIRGDDGRVTRIPAKRLGQAVSAAAAAQITQMMVTAVDEGEAKFAKPKGYSIAGKTGTAQVAVAGHYDDQKTIASFVGFAPADDPKFVMLVTLQEPTSSPWGSETAAPLFFAIAKDLFLYWGIASQ
jgi:stage V sporulation protein D (sporulation-specific penicillin-binding protein)